jgi:phosphatidylglycerophosphate synthase
MNTLSDFFSDKFINKGASKNNIVVYFLGRLTYPMSLIFSKMGVTPNQITTLSTFFAILSAIALVYSDNYVLFMTFWSISLLLDFCDGTLARMTGQVRITAFRYDHTSDLFKIFFVVLAASIKFNDLLLWSASAIAIFLFILYNALSCELDCTRRLRKDASFMYENDSIKRIKSYTKNTILSHFLPILFTISGHTLLLFLIFPVGKVATIVILIYFSLLSLLGIIRTIVYLKSLEKIV